MSRTTKKHRKTPTTNSPLHVVTDTDAVDTDTEKQATAADTKLWTALRDNPGTTTATLALTAGVGKSTAGKFLARWADDHLVTRTKGEGHRAPDTWALPSPASPDANPPSASDPTADSPVASAAGASQHRDAHPVEATEHAEQTAPGPVDIAHGDDAAHDEPDTTDGAATTPETPTPHADPGTVDADTASATQTPPAPTVDVSVSEMNNRLAKGALRDLVAEYLADRPGQSFGPAQIGKELGRSGGAVNNALEKLVAQGHANKTCEAPKRFAHHAA